MSDKHTPGPWECKHKHMMSEIYSGGSYICTVKHSSVEHIAEQDKANAELIAAAPELLKALEALKALGGVEHQYEESTDHRDFVIIAKAAIKKARGEE